MAAALIAAAVSPAGALGAGGVRLTASFDPGARLGGSTAMHVGLDVDSRVARSPATAVRLLYPKGLGLVSSGLGIASCTRPARDFQQVLLGSTTAAACPSNAVLAFGTAWAEVRLLDGQVIPEYANLTVLSGPLRQGSLGLVVFVEGVRPFGAYLAYAGELGGASGPFGGALTVALPAIPAVADLAVVALVQLDLSVGSDAIVYSKRVGRRTVPYHPGGIGLPAHCPKGGFRFRAQFTFQDGSHASANATVRCAQVKPANVASARDRRS